MLDQLSAASLLTQVVAVMWCLAGSSTLAAPLNSLAKCHTHDTAYLTVYEIRLSPDCAPAEEKVCQIAYDTAYTTQEKEVCSTVYEVECQDPDIDLDNCQTLTDKKCITIYKTTYRKECQTVRRIFEAPGQQCREVPFKKADVECHDVPRESCEDHPGQVTAKHCSMVPRQQCQKVLEQRPVQVPREICQSLPMQQCKQVAVHSPRRMAVPVAKPNCPAPAAYTPAIQLVP